MLTATGSFANMVKAGNLIDHVIKNGRTDIGESSFRLKKGNFMKKKKRRNSSLISAELT